MGRGGRVSLPASATRTASGRRWSVQPQPWLLTARSVSFRRPLRRSGRLNETDLAVKSQGWGWTLQRLPLAVRVALAGKLTLPPRPIDSHDALLAVMARAE